MPKFKVCVQQYVENIASVEVEAETAEAAVEKVREDDDAASFDWVDGDDAYDMEVYAVLDEAGEAVWER